MVKLPITTIADAQARLHGRLRFLAPLARFHNRIKPLLAKLKLVNICVAILGSIIALFTIETLPKVVTKPLGAFALGSGLLFLLDRAVWALNVPIPPRPWKSSGFLLHVQDLALRPIVRMCAAGNDEDLQKIADWEFDAFGFRTGRDALYRRERLRPWLNGTDETNGINGVAAVMLWEGTEVGYSVALPISGLDAKRFRKGQLKEWGLVPSIPSKDGPIYLYVQGAYLDIGFRDARRRQRGETKALTSEGLAQAALIRHVVMLVFSLHRLRGDGVTGEMPETMVLADIGSLSGAAMQRDLGLKPLGSQSADERPIMELRLGGVPDSSAESDTAKIAAAVWRQVTMASPQRC